MATHSTQLDTAGTALVGYVTTTRAELTRAFGEPMQYEEGEKVTVEWCLQFEDGTIATVYDWKRYEDGTPELNEVYEWHVGGVNEQAVTLVNDELKGTQFGDCNLCGTPIKDDADGAAVLPFGNVCGVCVNEIKAAN